MGAEGSVVAAKGTGAVTEEMGVSAPEFKMVGGDSLVGYTEWKWRVLPVQMA